MNAPQTLMHTNLVDWLAVDVDCWVACCDGSAWPNPGRMGMGVVVYGPQGQRDTLSQTTTATGCNNEAEMRACVMALERLLALGATAAIVCTDSRVLLEQLQRASAGERLAEQLTPWVERLQALQTRIPDLAWRWVPRHRNTEADTLARAALGLPAKIKAPAGTVRRR